MMSVDLDQSILVAALEGFENQLARLEAQIAFVRQQVPGKKALAKVSRPTAATAKAGKNRAVTEEGRKRMAEAQKRRWAKVRAAKSK